MKITVLTIFPEMFEGPLGTSILKRARERGLLRLGTVNFRDYALSKHKNVDDGPFGGGAGMLLKPEPVFAALEAVRNPRGPTETENPGNSVSSEGAAGSESLENSAGAQEFKGRVILMSPQGEPFTQRIAERLAKEEELVFICGHYEGFDERIRTLADEELSIGDYVLTGGELPAMVVIDSLCRLIPGVLGEAESHQTDSFSDGLLEHPHYTRPREFRGMTVPEVLLSGNHEEIRRWRRKEALRRTWLRRRSLLEAVALTDEDQLLLEEICREEGI